MRLSVTPTYPLTAPPYLHVLVPGFTCAGKKKGGGELHSNSPDLVLTERGAGVVVLDSACGEQDGKNARKATECDDEYCMKVKKVEDVYLSRSPVKETVIMLMITVNSIICGLTWPSA